MTKSVIKFKCNESGTAVYAVYSLIASDILTIDRPWIERQLTLQEFDSYAVLEQGVQELIDRVNKSVSGSGKIRVAELKNAEVCIRIEGDSKAYLTIVPPVGGAPASLDMVKKALAAQGIRHGFLLDAIRMAIISGEAEDLLIAISDKPVDGEDTRFVCVLPEIKIRTPRISKKGKTDYRDLGDVTVVEPGQPLMRRIPATGGTQSKNIFGEPIETKPGVESSFADGLKGAKPSAEDPDLLVATEAGQPIIVERGVNIESTMSLAHVDLSSGNISFDGSVIVSGDVERGGRIHATGDITVRGMVESANLDAGGDIVIRGVIIGTENKHTKKIENANIKATGSISAKGIEYANLCAENNVYVEDWVINSNICAVNEVIVGNVSASKGQIIGGKVSSGILVKAIRFGSNSGVSTIVEVGDTSKVREKLDHVNNEIKKQKALLQDLHKKILSFKNNPTRHAQSLLKETSSSYVFIKDSIEKLEAEKITLISEKDRWKNAKIISEKIIYAGVTAIVAGQEKQFKDDVGKRALLLKDGKLSSSFNINS